MVSKKQHLKDLDHYEWYQDNEGRSMDQEDFKDQIYARWLYKATRQLRRMPEYRWLFQEGAPEWWSAEQVAQYMQVGKKTVYTWARDIIGARPSDGKTGYRIPMSGLIIFLADLEDEEPPELIAEDVERLTQPHTTIEGEEEPPERTEADYTATLPEGD